MTGGRVRGWIRGRLSRKRLTVVGTLAVLAVGVVVVVRALDADAVVAAAGAADPTLLVVALGVYVLSWPVRGRRYADARGHGPPLPDRIPHCDRIRQSDREPDRPRAGRRRGPRVPAQDRRDVPYPTGVASLAVERAFDLVAIGVLGGVALAFLLLTGRSPGSGDSVGTVAPSTALAAAAGIAAVAATVSVATVAVARSDRRFGLRSALRPSIRLSRAVDAVVRFGSSVGPGRRCQSSTPRCRVPLERRRLDARRPYGRPRARGAHGRGVFVPTPTLLVVGTLAVSVGNLAKVLPLSQGGIGLYEAAFTGLVVSTTGLPVETALAAAILDHALKNAVTLAGGGVAALALGLSPTAGPASDGDPRPEAVSRRRGSERGRRERVVEFRTARFLGLT